jgi:hypothetical protein
LATRQRLACRKLDCHRGGKIGEVSAPAWLGALAGLFSSILLAMLMITYHTDPHKRMAKSFK